MRIGVRGDDAIHPLPANSLGELLALPLSESRAAIEPAVMPVTRSPPGSAAIRRLAGRRSELDDHRRLRRGPRPPATHTAPDPITDDPLPE